MSIMGYTDCNLVKSRLYKKQTQNNILSFKIFEKKILFSLLFHGFFHMKIVGIFLFSMFIWQKSLKKKSSCNEYTVLVSSAHLYYHS